MKHTLLLLITIAAIVGSAAMVVQCRANEVQSAVSQPIAKPVPAFQHPLSPEFATYTEIITITPSTDSIRQGTANSVGPNAALVGDNDIKGFSGGPIHPGNMFSDTITAVQGFLFAGGSTLPVGPERLFYFVGLALLLGGLGLAAFTKGRMLKEGGYIGGAGLLVIAVGVLVNTYPWVLAIGAVFVLIGTGWLVVRLMRDKRRMDVAEVTVPAIEEFSKTNPDAAKELKAIAQKKMMATGNFDGVNKEVHKIKGEPIK